MTTLKITDKSQSSHYSIPLTLIDLRFVLEQNYCSHGVRDSLDYLLTSSNHNKMMARSLNYQINKKVVQ